MFATIRVYAGNTDLIDVLLEHESDVKRLITEIDGFRSYYLLRTADGGPPPSVSMRRRRAHPHPMAPRVCGSTRTCRTSMSHRRRSWPATCCSPSDPTVRQARCSVTLITAPLGSWRRAGWARWTSGNSAQRARPVADLGGLDRRRRAAQLDRPRAARRARSATTRYWVAEHHGTPMLASAAPGDPDRPRLRRRRRGSGSAAAA